MIEKAEKEIGIILAAGLGTRLKPLTDKTAKPLIKVNGKPMIETVIDGLRLREISHIFVVTGYKSEQFQYLADKYENLSVIENKEYRNKNNISSIRSVCEVLEEENADFFICEADICIWDAEIFNSVMLQSCYYGKMISGYSEDWVFEQDSQGRITRVGKGGNNVYNMTGIAYFCNKDAKILASAVKDAYCHDGHETLFWDDVVNSNLDRLDLTIHEIEEGKVVEIDTIEELKIADASYLNIML